MDSAQVRSIQSLGRGLEVLQRIEDNGNGLSLRQLHMETGIPKASLLRILKTLGEHARIDKSAEGHYLAAQSVARSTHPQSAIGTATSLAQPLLKRLREQSDWPSDLAIRDGLRMKVVASNRSLYGGKWRRSVMDEKVDLLSSALGRAFLAHCPANAAALLIEQIYADDQRRRRMHEANLRELEATRRRGFGVRDAHYPGPDSHHLDALLAIAVPVMVEGSPVASMSCVWDAGSVPMSSVIESSLAHLVRAAAELGRRMAREET